MNAGIPRWLYFLVLTSKTCLISTIWRISWADSFVPLGILYNLTIEISRWDRRNKLVWFDFSLFPFSFPHAADRISCQNFFLSDSDFFDSGLKVKFEDSKLASKAVWLHIKSTQTFKYQFVSRFPTFLSIWRNRRQSLFTFI